MKKYICVIIFFQLAGCQPVKDKKQPREFTCPKEGFCIQDSLLFYNGKKIPLSLDVNSLIPALGNYDRVIEDKWGGTNVKNWYWKKNKHYAYLYSKDSLITFRNGFKNDYEEYKTIEEITAKYGMYDSLNVHYNKKIEINRFYSWDRLGIQAVSINDTLASIYLHVNPIPVTHISYDKRDPAYAYTGKLSINGVVLDLAERKTNTWSKDMKALGISSKEYSLPGDSKDWYRVKETPYFIVIFERDESALNKLGQPNKDIPDFIKKVRITYK